MYICIKLRVKEQRKMLLIVMKSGPIIIPFFTDEETELEFK